jgi:hypothetical protein
MLAQRTQTSTGTTPPTANTFGKTVMKWVLRVASIAAAAVAYMKWKEVAEAYEFENGIMGTYRPIVLGLACYVFWVFTRRIDGSSYKDTERPADDPQRVSSFESALFVLFVCVAIAAGFFAAQFVYVTAIDLPMDEIVARVLSFIAYVAGAGIVLGVSSKITFHRE